MRPAALYVAQGVDADGCACHTIHIVGTGQRVATLCGPSGQERARYARLFAVAPELLEVLQALMARDLDTRLMGLPELARAHSVIDKATGGAS